MPDKIAYEMPVTGQVMIQVSGKGAERSYLIGRVTTVEVTATFDKDGKPKEVVKWMAWIIFKVHMYRAFGKGDTYTPGDGSWHPPTEEEMTWPGVKEAIAASKTDSAPAPEVVVPEPPKPPVSPVPSRRGAQPSA